MAAKQRLSRGRKNARQFKLNLICDLLGMPKRLPQPTTSAHRSSSTSNPFRVARGCAPGSVRMMMTPTFHPPVPSSTVPDLPTRTSSSSSSISGVVPDDPNPGRSALGGLSADSPNVQHI
uniref:BHLH domain-containing protein n=1 Tax=Steinernema glaseri TaxID=37863 RepID=A0A1I7YGE4_9BILA